MANLTFRDAQMSVRVAQNGVVPIEARIDRPLASLNTASAQPGDRSRIVLAVERPQALQPDQDQYVLYHRLPELQTFVNAGAIAVSVKIAIRLRQGNKTITDTVFFPIRGRNILRVTDASFQTADFIIYVEESHDAVGAVIRSLSSIGLGGGGGGGHCAGCSSPTSDQQRFLCALSGCY